MGKVQKAIALVLACVFALIGTVAVAADASSTASYPYYNVELGFSLSIPTEYQDQILIMEGDGYVEFRHRASFNLIEEQYGYESGILFSIGLYETGNFSYQDLPNYRILTVEPRGTYVLYFPTDVQFLEATMDSYYEVYDAFVYATGYPSYITELHTGLFHLLSSAEITSDTLTHWARGAIERWCAYGIVSGYDDGTFRPDHSITRAEVATIFSNLMGYTRHSGTLYTDVSPNDWYFDAIQKVTYSGVMSGYGDGIMGPMNRMTRQDAVVMLCKALNIIPADGISTSFDDDSDIADYARGYIAALCQDGLMAGGNRGQFRPTDYITRAEMVAFLDSAIALYIVEPGTYTGDYDGHAIILAEDVTLEDATIQGNLIISDQVSRFTNLQNTTVSGTIYGSYIEEP